MARENNIVVLILLQCIFTVQPLSVGHCFDNMRESRRTGVDDCSVAKDFLECILRQTKDPSVFTVDSVMIDLEKEYEEALAKRGVHCDIDLRAILESVIEDRRNAVTHTTKKPTGYDGAATVGDCLNAYTANFTHDVSAICSTMVPFFKCAIKVTRLYNLHDDAFSSQESEIKKLIVSPDLNCKFNIRQLAAEVAREQNASSGDSGNRCLYVIRSFYFENSNSKARVHTGPCGACICTLNKYF